MIVAVNKEKAGHLAFCFLPSWKKLMTGTVLFLLLIRGMNTMAQQPERKPDNPYPDTLVKSRLAGVLAAQAAVYSGAITGLSYLYYKDHDRSGFYFYNDNDSWLQMDKMGHLFSTYYLSKIMHASYRWAGVDNRRAVLFGSMMAYAFQTNIEILDGISSDWGFSWGDIVANTTGMVLFAGQQLAWNEQRIVVKYSWHPTDNPTENPAILGSNWVENMWEDYNGMTFWLSGNISSFLPERSKFPRWLNVAFGYGGEGLAVPDEISPEYRQFYFSLDADLTRIRTRSKTLKMFLTLLNLVKIPFPTLEYNTTGAVKFHWIYF